MKNAYKINDNKRNMYLYVLYHWTVFLICRYYECKVRYI